MVVSFLGGVRIVRSIWRMCLCLYWMYRTYLSSFFKWQLSGSRWTPQILCAFLVSYMPLWCVKFRHRQTDGGRLSQLKLWQYFIVDRATYFGLNKSHFLTTCYLKVLCLTYLTGVRRWFLLKPKHVVRSRVKYCQCCSCDRRSSVQILCCSEFSRRVFGNRLHHSQSGRCGEEINPRKGLWGRRIPHIQ